ncbi:MAG: DUF58 domain-containing protein [Pirellulaceae bacterium]|nr:DUF58 domain-containing protein [Planctomycetales bacterium]
MEGYLETGDTLDARQFYIAIKRLADNLAYGTDRSPYLGSGMEYVQSRPYQYGDPIKAIDWRVTARTGRVFIKEYEAPKRMPAYLMLDTSASMAVSSLPRSKYAVAVHVAGGVAFACLDRVSPVGIIGVGDTYLQHQPSLSRDQVMQWLHQVRRFRYDETTTLGKRLLELNSRIKQRALVIVLSDLHDQTALPVLKTMGQKHDCVVLQLRDPAEAGLRGAGLMRATEAETGRHFVTHGRARWLDQETTQRELRRAGIDHLLLSTDEPVAHRLRHFMQSRGLLGKGAR